LAGDTKNTSGLITRRRAIIAGLASVGGIMLARRPEVLPPTYGNLLRMGDTLTYAAHRALLPEQALAKEYTTADLTSFPATGTVNPADQKDSALASAYRRLHAGGFADWSLSVEGRVRNPRVFSLRDLKQLPSRTQITRHTCEEGWTAIGQWTGVPLGAVLDAAGVLPTARFAVFSSHDDWVDGIDMLDAFHPQTILAYGMNGRDLPLQHGAPVRLRVERQIGYKSMKYVNRIVIKDEFDDGAEKGNIRNGWAWYNGI
jgi:DMSO/TMAO reductase YedYZ molybdopterin-dependent catalytic subunit